MEHIADMARWDMTCGLGVLGRAMKAIPVVRPEDLERAGPGFVTVKGVQVPFPLFSPRSMAA